MVDTITIKLGIKRLKIGKYGDFLSEMKRKRYLNIVPVTSTMFFKTHFNRHLQRYRISRARSVHDFTEKYNRLVLE